MLTFNKVAIVLQFLIISLFFIEISGGRQRQQGAPLYQDDVTVTVTHYTTTSSIMVKVTHAICASLVSASEPCIRKRNAQSPVIVAFDEQLHDDLFSYFLPAEYREEPSAFTVEDLRARAYYEDTIRTNVESSFQGRAGADDGDGPPVFLGRLGFKVKQALGIRETFTKTYTHTSTILSTVLVPTSTKTFILENCLPPNFNFPEC